MARSLLIAWFFVAVSMMVGCDRGTTAQDEPSDSVPPRDLILITIDTLRADRLGIYGHEGAQTPIIDSLARRGVRFDRAATSFPRTTPAIASLMTGLWPHHHGSREVHVPFEQGTTLAEILRGHDFWVAGVTANSAAGPKMNLDRGFDEFVPSRALRPGRPAERLTDEALRLAAQVPEGKRLFLWAHYFDPHHPYSPPKDWEQPEGKGCRGLGRYSRAIGRVYANDDGVAEAVLDECLALYDAEVAYTDSHVGRLLAGLESLGRLADALVIVTSDHGENFGEGGLYYQHGPSLNEASSRVPLIISGPGVEEGRIDDGIVRLEDIVPTLLSIFEIPEAEWPVMDGRDFSQRLRPGGNSAESAEILAYAESGGALTPDFHPALVSGRPDQGWCLNGESFSLCWSKAQPARLLDRRIPYDQRIDVGREHPIVLREMLEGRKRWPVSQTRLHSVRNEEYKLVERPRLEGGFQRSLHHLASDPREEIDVTHQYPEIAKSLGAALDRWTAEIAPHEPSALSKEDEESLRALGYVE